MKKVMLALGFLVIVAFSFASENKNDFKVYPSGMSKGGIEKIQAVFVPGTVQDFSCTVTFKASVGPSYASIEATCSATSESCDDATSQAANCITSAIRRGISLLNIK